MTEQSERVIYLPTKQKLSEEIKYMDSMSEEDIIKLQEEENKKDVAELLKNTIIIHEISADLSSMIEAQGEQVMYTKELTEESEECLGGAVVQIGKAKKSYFSSLLLKGTLISTVVGLAGGGLIGGIIGYSAGAGILGSGIAGGVVGSGVCGGVTYGSIKGKVKE
jgi:hypothetical protein